MKPIDKIKNFLNKRKAYRLTFPINDAMAPEHIRIVLDDLAHFCYANRTAVIKRIDGTIDETAMNIAEGRRQVYLRIMTYLRLSEDDLSRLIGRSPNIE